MRRSGAADGDVRFPPDIRARGAMLEACSASTTATGRSRQRTRASTAGSSAAVTSTGIYCRPELPGAARRSARTSASTRPRPRRRRPASAPASAAARTPAPGSPEWDARADLVGRAMRLIADGVVDREGVGGLGAPARLQRAPPPPPARSPCSAPGRSRSRAPSARRPRGCCSRRPTCRSPRSRSTAGFASVRQFNATMREVFAITPRELRAPGRATSVASRRGGAIDAAPAVPRAVRRATGCSRSSAARAVPGVEEVADGGYRRSLRLPHGAGVVELAPGRRPRPGALLARRTCATSPPAVQPLPARCSTSTPTRCAVVERARRATPCSARSCARTPGRRVPGSVDGARARRPRGARPAGLGDRCARRSPARLVASHGEPLRAAGRRGHAPVPDGGGARRARSRRAADAARPRRDAGPARRARSPAVSWSSTRAPTATHSTAGLLALPGIGPWTAGYVAMRALRDPDAFPAGDLGVRRALEALGVGDPGHSLERFGEPWQARTAPMRPSTSGRSLPVPRRNPQPRHRHGGWSWRHERARRLPAARSVARSR